MSEPYVFVAVFASCHLRIISQSKLSLDFISNMSDWSLFALLLSLS